MPLGGLRNPKQFIQRLLRVLTSYRVETVMPRAPISVRRFKKVMQIFNVKSNKMWHRVTIFYIFFLFFLTGLKFQLPVMVTLYLENLLLV